MTKLEQAVESTWAHVLARFVTPLLASAILLLGGFVGNAVLSEVKAMRADVNNALIKQENHSVRLSEIERRLNSRKSPIAEVRGTYGGAL